MSVHDKAAARHARRFSLYVARVGHGCMQAEEFHGLTELEAKEEMQAQRELWPAPGYHTSFETYPRITSATEMKS